MTDVSTAVQEIGEANFAAEVLEAEQPVLVDFWARWCGPCKSLSPIIDRLAADYEGRVKVVKVDIDQVPKIAEDFGVRGVPNVAIFNQGEAVARVAGLKPKGSYVSLLEAVLAGGDSDAISDALVQDPDSRISFILTASLDEIRTAFARHPELSNEPVTAGLTPLGIALRAGLPIDKKELLASYVSDLSFDELVGLGRLDRVRAAIESAPGQVNQPAADGSGPLTIAILNAQSECVDLLLRAGADPNPPEGDTPALSPIELAVIQQDSRIVEQLLEHGANLLRKTAQAGGTLLHLAVQMSNKDLVLLFIRLGIDPKTTNVEGDTPYEASLKALTESLANETAPQRIEAIQQGLDQLEELKPMLT